MQLGFASAILPDLDLEEVLTFAAAEGFECVELMCWPVAASDQRRYAGVTHIDVAGFDEARAAAVLDLCRRTGVAISALGYYPNPLTPDLAERAVYVEHLERVVDAARLLGVDVVNTFIGRDQHRPTEEQWDTVEEVWRPLVAHATAAGVQLAIENCPMLFTLDEWPGGKNLVTAPAVWDELFRRVPEIGLNFDPSHPLWQGIDVDRALSDAADHIRHIHLKDERVDPELLYQRGVLGLGWHEPKIPGLGDIDWPSFFTTLRQIGWERPVVIEVEDRASEDSLAGRKEALRRSRDFVLAAMR